MRRGWPARVEVEVDGWAARLSEGVTQRANAVLPVAAPYDLEGALVRVEHLYREHGVVPRFQVGPAAQPQGLDEVLARRGYVRRSPVVVEVARIGDVLSRVPRAGRDVEVRSRPGADWMDAWWSVDGRGGERARAVAHGILGGGPALYGSTREAGAVAAVGRLALVGEWAGLYCMAVRPGARRSGHATTVLRALLEHGVARGAGYAWLQVAADNEAARTLYERVGFVPCSGYHYRVLSR